MSTQQRPPKAYSYLRFSTPEQAAGDSARRQTELAQAYCEQHGLSLDTTLRIVDAGVSAFRGANRLHGALKSFLRLVESGEVERGSYFLVENLDRLSREHAWRAGLLACALIAEGIVIVTLERGAVYDATRLDNQTFLQFELLLDFERAHQESVRKSSLSKANWAQKRRRAQEGDTSKPMTRRCPAWLRFDEDQRRFVEIQERAQVVRWIFDRLIDGWGEHRIANHLNADRTPTFGSAQLWHRSYIHKIATNPAVAGTLVPHVVEYSSHNQEKIYRRRIPQQPIQAAYPAVVSAEQFERVQIRRLGIQNAPKARGSELKSLLASLAKCAACGSSMTRVNKGSRSKPYLVCTRAKAGAGCVYRSVPLETVEQAVFRELPKVRFAKVESGKKHIQLTRDAKRNALDIENLVAAVAMKPTTRLLERLGDALNAEEELRAAITTAELLHRSAPNASEIAKRLRSCNVTAANALLREKFRQVIVDVNAMRMTFVPKSGSEQSISMLRLMQRVE